MKKTLKKICMRPILPVLFLYMFYLAAVLIFFPEAGDKIYGWGRKKEKAQTFLEGALVSDSTYEIRVRILAADKSASGIRYTAGVLEAGYELRCFLYLDETEKHYRGETLKVRGRVSYPERPANPGQFDTEQYYRLCRVTFSMKPDDVKLIASPGPVFCMLMSIRDESASLLMRVLGDHYGSIMCAMLLGEKGYLDAQEKDLFSSGGISHIIAISGLHLGILAQEMEKLLRKVLKGKSASVLTLAIVWSYAFFTGGAVATMRAAMMLSVRKIARWSGERYDEPSSIGLSMLLLLIMEPMNFLSGGFWMSYGALLGMRFGKVFLMHLTFLPRLLRDRLAQGTGILLVSAPLSLWYSYVFSPLSVFLNLWVLFIVKWVIVAGLLILMTGWILPFLTVLPSLFIQTVLWSFEKGSMILSSLKPLMILGKPSVRTMLLYFLILFLLYRILLRKREKRKILLWYLLPLIVLMCLPKNTFSAAFLSVGQGDCTVVRWRSRTIIIDMGPSYETVIKPYLRMEGVRDIDLLILTHPDQDHMAGMKEMLEEGSFSVRYLLAADQKAQDTAERMEVTELAVKQGAKVKYLRAGDEIGLSCGSLWRKEEVFLHILSPEEEFFTTNDGSLVIYMETPGFDLMLMGDAPWEREGDVLERYRRLAGGGERERPLILKAGHHGSRFSTGEALLQGLRPDLAVISCGKRNRYGHPHREVLQRLEEALIPVTITPRDGCTFLRWRLGRCEFYNFPPYRA